MALVPELHRVYVALGSNLGDRAGHIHTAMDEISALPCVARLTGSSLYETEPMGPQDQPDYLNAVCSFDYVDTASALLLQLKSIESAHGRQQQTQRWSARPLDLDILLFGEQRISEPDLTVPHAGLAERSFVLWPLAELAPDLDIPGLGTVASLCQSCQQFGIRRFQGGQADREGDCPGGGSGDRNCL